MQCSRVGFLCLITVSAFWSLASYAVDAPSTTTRPLQLEDYLNWEWVANPQIAPNGKTIVYTRSHVNTHKDSFDHETWIMDADGGRNRRLLDQPAGEVTWSPDSTRIAYVAKVENGDSELFVRAMNGQGQITQLTYDGKTPSKLSWSPDGQWLAFLARVPGAPEPAWTINMPAKLDGANWVDEATVVDTLHWRQDILGLRPKGYSHIFIVPAQGGTPRQLTQGAWQVGAWYAATFNFSDKLEWSPDGQSIVFSADREPGADFAVARSSLYRVDVATGNVHRITTSPEFVMKLKVSPNGRHIAYIGADNITASNFPTPQLRVVNMNGSDDRLLVADIPDLFGVTLHWSGNGRGLYYIHDKAGTHNVHYVSLQGKTKSITSGAQSLSLSAVSNSGIAVGTRTTADQPGDIVRFDLATGRNLQRLTAVNDDLLRGIKLGNVEEIWYDSTDSTRIQGWIVYPPNFDPGKKYPLILDIHGGPEGMYTGGFRFTMQEWAAQGYVVVYTNPRGSTGYSSEFTRAIYNAYPGQGDYEDLMHGVDTVIRRGFIDEDRLYVQGCSGGGILTSWVVTQTDRFAGAAALCTAVNAISKAGTADIPAWNYNRFKNKFWDDPSAWLEHSSIMHVDKVKTPTLLMVGEHDTRTPVGQSEEFYTALKMLGVPTKLILLKEESHATWLFQHGHPSNFLRSQLYLRKWFSQWRRVEGANGPAWESPAAP